MYWMLQRPPINYSRNRVPILRTLHFQIHEEYAIIANKKVLLIHRPVIYPYPIMQMYINFPLSPYSKT